MASRRRNGTPPTGTEWNNEPIPGLLVRRAHQVQTALWSREVGTELTSPQYAVLASVYRAPAMDQVTISQLASLDRSTLADILARLDSRGLIARVRDLTDGRRNLVSLTPKGRALVEEVAPRVAEVDRALVECFGKGERKEFLHQLVRFVKHGEQLISQPRETERRARR